MSLRSTALYNDLLEDISVFLYRHYYKTRYQGVLDPAIILSIETDPDIDPKTFAVVSLAKTFLKKFQDGIAETADSVALEKFLASNVQCKNWSLRNDRSLEEDLLLGLFKQEVYRFFNKSWRSGILDYPHDIIRLGTVGPGASLGSLGTDFYTKMCAGKLTSTSEALYLMYWHYIQDSPRWLASEKERRSKFGRVDIVRGNRLSFVPKTVDTSRVICTEPLLNMYFQQGVKCILEKRLHQYFGIDLATQQECNRDLARMGSMTNDLCTIDLSSASDSVSLSMIRETFPRDIVTWLELLRSPEVQLPDGNWVDLDMISSMGNAYTFPLETLIFSCVVSAAYQAQEIELRKGYGERCEYSPDDGVFVNTKRMPNFGVFGDDIIIEKQAHRQVCLLLKLLGFTVNAEKSFSEGPFRESCGGDYFRGYPTRGVYIKSLASQASRFIAINQLNRWSAIHGIPLVRTVGRIMKHVRKLPVPLYENDDAGIKVPSDIAFDLGIPHPGPVIYRRWETNPVKIRIKDGALKVPKRYRQRHYNADGLLLAALRGDVRNFAIGSRLGPAKYRTKEALSPSWDWVPSVGDVASPIGQQRLTTAIRINCGYS